MKTPEGKVKDAVKRYLDSVGAYWFMPVQTGYGTTTLDFLVCYKGVFIGVETKAPTGELTGSARQRLITKKIQDAGGCALVIHDVAQVKHYIERLDKSFVA